MANVATASWKGYEVGIRYTGEVWNVTVSNQGYVWATEGETPREACDGMVHEIACDMESTRLDVIAAQLVMHRALKQL